MGVAAWFLKMFAKVLKPFAKFAIIFAILQAIEDLLNGKKDEDPTDPAVPEA